MEQRGLFLLNKGAVKRVPKISKGTTTSRELITVATPSQNHTLMCRQKHNQVREIPSRDKNWNSMPTITKALEGESGFTGDRRKRAANPPPPILVKGSKKLQSIS